MKKEECEQLIKALELDFVPVEFPPNSGMFVFAQVLKKIENHKGQVCPYKKILCQEGVCKECQIYLEWCKSLWA